MILNGALQTPRLLVRPFQADDAAHLRALFSDPAVARFVGDGLPLSGEQAEAWVRASAANLSRFGYGTGAVIEKNSGAFIGWGGVARPPDDEPEIVYGIEAARWGRGYGRELVQALVAFAAARGLQPLRATVDRRNTASVRLLTANGFMLTAADYRGEIGADLYVRP